MSGEGEVVDFLLGRHRKVCVILVLTSVLTGCFVDDVQIASTVDRPLNWQLISINSSGEESLIEEDPIIGITEFHSRMEDCSGDGENAPNILRLVDRETGAVVAERDLTKQPICNEERLVYDGETIKTIPGDIFDPWPDEYDVE